uniref:Vesicle transport protein n=1 Tax=Globodera rostochiensis TaxID=31243 RepID=A0A914HZL2_GLORO
MSSLADFVNEQRKFFKPGNLNGADDAQRLTEHDSAQNGQLPSGRNRKYSWMSFSSSSVSASLSPPDSNPCGLTRFQRIAAFFLCIFAAAFCFITAMMLIPVLVLQTRKFAALNTLGSAFFIVSFGFLWGPLAYCQFLFSEPRRVVTAVYLLSVLATLYTSLWLQSALLTIITAAVQSFGLVWFLLSYVPGGENGLKWMGRMAKMAFCARQSSTLIHTKRGGGGRC